MTRPNNLPAAKVVTGELAEKTTTALMEIYTWEKPDRHDVQAMEEAFMKYMRFCADNQVQMTNMTAYYVLGIDKDTAHEWAVRRKGTKEQQEFILKVRQLLSANREMLMSQGAVKEAVGIFWQKNYDGFRDNTEIVVTPNTQKEEYDADEIRQKYIEQENKKLLK